MNKNDKWTNYAGVQCDIKYISRPSHCITGCSDISSSVDLANKEGFIKGKIDD